jgi:hypothetical protein
MKALAKITRTAVAAIAVLLAAYAVWNWGAGTALWHTLKQQRRQGLPMSVADLAIPPVPLDRNAAPLLNRAFALLKRDRPAQLVAALARHRFDSGEGAETDCGLGRLHPAEQQRLTRAMAAPEIADALRLFEAAAARDACDFRSPYSDGSSAPMPHLEEVGQATRLLNARAWLLANAGQMGPALESIRIALRVANFLRREPLLISYRVHAGCEREALSCLNAVLNMGEPGALPADGIRALIRDVERHRDPVCSGLVFALDGERIILGRGVFDRLLRGEGSGGVGAPEIERVASVYARPMTRPLLKMDFRRYMIATAAYRARIQIPAHLWVTAAYPSRDVPRYCRITSAALPGIDRAMDLSLAVQTRIEMALVGLKAVLYHRRKQAYPASLAEAVDPDPLPLDPFTGSALRWQSDGKGFKVYSLGPNLADDGGRSHLPDGRTADLVWEVRR